MTTHCQSGAQGGNSERQNVGAVNSFDGEKKRGEGVVNFNLRTS